MSGVKFAKASSGAERKDVRAVSLSFCEEGMGKGGGVKKKERERKYRENIYIE